MQNILKGRAIIATKYKMPGSEFYKKRTGAFETETLKSFTDTHKRIFKQRRMLPFWI